MRSFILNIRKAFLRASGKITTTRIYLKSGQIIELDVSKLEWKYTGNTLTELTWSTEAPGNLAYIAIDQVAAITTNH